MGAFNTYNLNGNFTTDDGITLISPTWKISIFEFDDDAGNFSVLLHWIDASHDIIRILDNQFISSNFPTVTLIEAAIKTLPQFSNSTPV